MIPDTDPNEHEIDPPPTAEEKELARRALEHFRRVHGEKEPG